MSQAGEAEFDAVSNTVKFFVNLVYSTGQLTGVLLLGLLASRFKGDLEERAEALALANVHEPG